MHHRVFIALAIIGLTPTLAHGQDAPSPPAEAPAPETAPQVAPTSARKPVVLPPKLVQAPSPEEMSRFYPKESLEVPSKVVLSCVVTTQTDLRDCRVVSETPPGHGFGEAALHGATLMRVRPGSVDGKPYAGIRIRVPFTFNPPPKVAATPQAPTPRLRTLRSIVLPDLLEAVNEEDLNALYPINATTIAGKVVLDCAVTKAQDFKACRIVSEAPVGRGFGEAALNGVTLMRLKTSPAGAGLAVDGRLTFPVEFLPTPAPSPSRAAPPPALAPGSGVLVLVLVLGLLSAMPAAYFWPPAKPSRRRRA